MCLDVPGLVERRLAHGEILGFEFEINHNERGQRCGYLRVLPGHPWFEQAAEGIVGVSVHGGLTFSSHGTACPTHGPEAEWWIGFDCAHAGDLADPTLPIADARLRESNERMAKAYVGTRWAAVRTQEYVEAQIAHLAEQARDVMVL